MFLLLLFPAWICTVHLSVWIWPCVIWVCRYTIVHLCVIVWKYIYMITCAGTGMCILCMRVSACVIACEGKLLWSVRVCMQACVMACAITCMCISVHVNIRVCDCLHQINACTSLYVCVKTCVFTCAGTSMFKRKSQRTKLHDLFFAVCSYSRHAVTIILCNTVF